MRIASIHADFCVRDVFMAARDQLHHAARQALEKDGWTITHDPFKVPYGTTFDEIDLGAERLIAAEKGLQRIAVEVKSFLGGSIMSQFHTALGQYLNYLEALTDFEPKRVLYLALSQKVYRPFFVQDIVQRVLTRHQVRLIVFDPEQEEIVLWKN
jgi:hypothetical protein